MQSRISLATMTLVLCFPLAHTPVSAQDGTGNSCSGNIDSVDILGATAADSRAQIIVYLDNCTNKGGDGCTCSCFTINPLMIEAAADAALHNENANITWVTKKGVNWCTSFEIGSLPDFD